MSDVILWFWVFVGGLLILAVVLKAFILAESHRED